MNLVHFHHRFHDAIRLPGIGIGQHIAEKDRGDLPRETEFVFKPVPKAFGIESAVGGKFLLEIIDLRIVKNADVEFSCLLRFGIEP